MYVHLRRNSTLDLHMICQMLCTLVLEVENWLTYLIHLYKVTRTNYKSKVIWVGEADGVKNRLNNLMLLVC